MDIITIGFYLLVEDEDFQSMQNYYSILLKESNSLLWTVSCHVFIICLQMFMEK